MKLTDSDRDKIGQYLAKHWHTKICPQCKTGSYWLADTIFELREFQGGDLVIGQSKIVPVIPLTCSSCGHMLFLNAIAAGVLSPRVEDAKGGILDDF